MFQICNCLNCGNLSWKFVGVRGINIFGTLQFSGSVGASGGITEISTYTCKHIWNTKIFMNKYVYYNMKGIEITVILI